jgi:hydrogenase maturation protease
MARPILILGVGNEYRCDDAAGLWVARWLHVRGLPGTEAREHDGEAASLMEAWRGVEGVILVDAVAANLKPGSILRLDAVEHPIPQALFRCSTHAFGVAEAIELARALGELPSHIIVYGIVGKSWAPGAEPSQEVLSAISTVESAVIAEVERLWTLVSEDE